MRLENSWCLYNSLTGNITFLSTQYYNEHIREADTYQEFITSIVDIEENETSEEFMSSKLTTIKNDLASEKMTRNQLYLILTDACNMRCSYCRQRQENDYAIQNMSTKTAIDTIRDRFYSNEPLKSIVFYGGEPLLNKEVFQNSVSYVRMHLPKSISLSVITNGTLIDDSMAKFLAENGVYVVLSVDGYNEQQNQYRKMKDGKNAFPFIMTGLKNMLRYNVKVGLSCTVGMHNINYLPQIGKWFHQQKGIINICFGLPHFESDGILSNNISNYFLREKLIESYESEYGFIENAYKIMRDLLCNNFKINRCPSCGGRIVVRADQTYGVCTGSLVEGDKFYFQEIEQQKKLACQWREQSSPVNDMFCYSCAAFRVCGGGCPFDAYSISKNFYEKEYRRCLVTTSTLEWCFNWISKELAEVISAKGIVSISEQYKHELLIKFRKSAESPLKASESFGINHE